MSLQMDRKTRVGYDSVDRHELNESEKNEIRKADYQSDERKRKNKRNKTLLWVFIILVIILGLIYLLFK